MGPGGVCFDQGTMGPGGSVAGPYGRAVFLIALRRRIRVDSALRAREQAMVTFSIAFWGF